MAAQIYDGQALAARLQGVQPLQSLSGDPQGGVIQKFAQENSLAQQSAAPSAAASAPEQTGWKQMLNGPGM